MRILVWPTCMQHSINRARRRATSLIETNATQHHAAKVQLTIGLDVLLYRLASSKAYGRQDTLTRQ